MLSLNCLAKEKERGDFALCFFGGRGGGGMGEGSSGLGKHKNAKAKHIKKQVSG